MRGRRLARPTSKETRMRRLGLVMGTLLAISAVSPVAAVKPDRGCGNEAFELMTYTEFRNLSISVGVPEELLGADHEAFWVNSLDKNEDGLACIKDKPDTAGSLFGWIFNAVDNTANR
jgi:hypothetical protein